MSKGKKIVIISLLSVFVVLLGVVAIILAFGKDTSRTIMIYMSGNNLETDSYSATAELRGLDPSKIDLNKYHIIVYTGGTKKWHNFVDSNENAIYELRDTGFVKVATYEKSNMGDAENLSTFLKYGYENYPAANYDLMLWDHGAGSLGSIEDEFTRDQLSLSEFIEAFNNSPFNGKNKLQNIVFETCLNGTLEMATVLSPYANYLVASEEVTLGDNVESELVFLNKLGEIKDSYNFGVSYVNGYFEKLDRMNYIFDNTSEYGVINLNAIPELNNKLASLYEEINLSQNYSQVARARANSYQFAVNTSDTYAYDTVDLYEFVKGLETVSPAKAKEIEDYIKNKVVLYYVARTDHANGLSTYIPFNSKNSIVSMHFMGFKNTNLNEKYLKFIEDFHEMKNSTISSYRFKLDENEVVSSDNKEFKIKLTEDQINNYATSKYIIFEKTSDGLYMPIYVSTDVTLDDDGYLSTKTNDSLISIVDEENNRKVFFTVLNIATDEKNNKEYTAPIVLTGRTEDGMPTVTNGVMHLKKDKDNKVTSEKVYLTSTDEETGLVNTGIAVNLDDYTAVAFSNLRYNILDANGNYTTNWESSGTLYFEEVKVNEKYHFEASSLSDGDYYCVFVVYDIQNNPNYSSLIKIN